MDDEHWQRILARLPEVDAADGPPLAVAFITSDAYAARSGTAWLWWPGSRAQPVGPVPFDGRFPADWGLLLVMNDTAIARVCACLPPEGNSRQTESGTACMAHLARRLDIKPFVLRQRDELAAAGVLEFIETLELATPKH